jgi:hypothetical protein
MLVTQLRFGRQEVRVVLAAVGQQGCPMSPQPAHLPAVQLPTGAPQLVPAARHLPAMQQPPAAQMSPAQQSWPAAPHSSQVVPLQARPSLQRLPAQQVWVVSPQATHWGSAGAVAGAHSESGWPQALPISCPGQHFFPTVPQVAQAPVAHRPAAMAQVPPLAAQTFPAQQPPAAHC